MKIEWGTEAYFHSDGTRRKKPLASAFHGYMAKLRGTLTGNEKLRSQGIREMREAKAVKKWKKDQKKRQGSSNISSPLVGAGNKNQSARPRLQHHASSHRLVGAAPRRQSTGLSHTSTRSASRRSQLSHTSRRQPPRHSTR